MNRPEDKIQYAIVQWFQSQGVYFFSVPNEGHARSVVRASHMKSLGLRSGASDLVIVLQGRVIFLEVKSETGSQSHLQEVFQNRVEALGHRYYVVRSVSEVAKILGFEYDGP